MTELLHAWALAPAAIGTCCLAADRRRVRVPELAASALMLVAMLDSAWGRVLAPVFWAGLMLASAIGLAALRRTRTTGSRRAQTRMTVHTTAGMVAMSALLLAMGRTDAGSSAHTHGMSTGALTAVLLAGALVYAAVSVVAATRAHGWLGRTQYAAMGVSTVVMGIALLG